MSQQQVSQGQGVGKASCERCASIEAMNTQLREQLDKQEDMI